MTRDPDLETLEPKMCYHLVIGSSLPAKLELQAHAPEFRMLLLKPSFPAAIRVRNS